MKISILVPTLFPDKARAAIDDLRPQLAGIEHEFVVVSPHEICGPSIVHVREDEPKGPTAAHNIAFARATGEVALVAADDIRFAPSAIAETLYRFADPGRAFPLVVTYPRAGGSMLLAHTVLGRLVPTFFAIGRRDVDAAGGWIDPHFVAGYGDCDLGFRTFQRGGKVLLLESPFVEIVDRAPEDVAPTKYNQKILGEDYRRLLEKWRHGVHPGWGEVENGVNLTIPVDFLPLVTDDPRSLIVDGPEAILDLRILARLGLSIVEQNAEMSKEVAAGALAYLRWLSATGDSPLHVVILDRNQPYIFRPNR